LLREDGRENGELREVRMTRNINKYAEGSCLITFGDTRVHCTATVEDEQPRFLRDTQEGWVTAEYSMLPRATKQRTRRESEHGPSGRTQEIQRLIGRSLRAVCDMRLLGPLTIRVDCDVLQADGGTRTASITGAFVAVADACAYLRDKNIIKRWPLNTQVAAVSVGMVSGEVLLDLCYAEDSKARVDLNLVMTSRGGIVEVQGTAEGAPFSRQQLQQMMDLGQQGLQELFARQRETLGEVLP